MQSKVRLGKKLNQNPSQGGSHCWQGKNLAISLRIRGFKVLMSFNEEESVKENCAQGNVATRGAHSILHPRGKSQWHCLR